MLGVQSAVTGCSMLLFVGMYAISSTLPAEANSDYSYYCKINTVTISATQHTNPADGEKDLCNALRSAEQALFCAMKRNSSARCGGPFAGCIR